MSLVEQLPVELYLKERHIRFEVALHRGAYTAKSEANALGLPTAYVLKVVVLRLEDAYAIAVVPASRRIDMSLVMGVIPDRHVRLATEDEIASRFPGFELGALPPLPSLLDVRVFVDPTVFDHHEVAFADGRQTESIIASPRELFWGQDIFVAPISRKPEVWGPWELEGDAIDLGEKNQNADTIKSHFAQFGARIDDLLRTVEHTPFVSGLKAELAVWREWIDEARLQLALGTMEERASVAEAMKALENLYSRMVNRVEDLEHLPEPLPVVSEAVKHELERAKEELSSPDSFAS